MLNLIKTYISTYWFARENVVIPEGRLGAFLKQVYKEAANMVENEKGASQQLQEKSVKGEAAKQIIKPVYKLFQNIGKPTTKKVRKAAAEAAEQDIRKIARPPSHKFPPRGPKTAPKAKPKVPPKKPLQMSKKQWAALRAMNASTRKAAKKGFLRRWLAICWKHKGKCLTAGFLLTPLGQETAAWLIRGDSPVQQPWDEKPGRYDIPSIPGTASWRKEKGLPEIDYQQY